MKPLKCDHCGENLYREGQHDHIRRWLVWGDDCGEREYALKVCAFDAEVAAETWAEQTDHGNDYSIVNGCEAIANVEGPDGVVTRCLVSGEQTVVYHATAEEI
jgi:hypothetical protein